MLAPGVPVYQSARSAGPAIEKQGSLCEIFLHEVPALLHFAMKFLGNKLKHLAFFIKKMKDIKPAYSFRSHRKFTQHITPRSISQ